MNFVRLSRRPCLIEEDDGLAYLADMEAGYLGSNHWQSRKENGLFSRFLYYTRNNGDNYSISSPRIVSFSVSSSSTSSSSRPTSKFYDTRFEERHQSHFLDGCFLCRKPLRTNEDIFMYRGDTPFCSVECRYKQIVIDEINEKKFQLSASVKALRKKDQRKSTSTTTTTKAHGYSLSYKQYYCSRLKSFTLYEAVKMACWIFFEF